MQEMTERRVDDLVRAGNRHGMITKTNRRRNTCTVEYADGGRETCSWWALRMGNDDTARHVAGVSSYKQYQQSR